MTMLFMMGFVFALVIALTFVITSASAYTFLPLFVNFLDLI